MRGLQLSCFRGALANGAQETVNTAIIGVGWRGGQLLDEIVKLPGVRVVALCDPDTARLAEGAKKVPQVRVETDMRRVFDDPEIDAVVIATCNHWHCLAAVWACEAGKHVYCEKPLSHTLWEGRALMASAAKNRRMVQVGTQQRSDPLQAEVKEFIHGKQVLGKIQSVVIPRFGIREPIGKGERSLAPPKTLDYNLWLGPAQDEPILRTNEFHYSWHWAWNTGNGECGNWGVHLLDDVVNVVFQDQQKLPNRVAASGGRVVWDDAGQTPNLHLAFLEAGEIPVLFALSNLPASPGQKRPLKYESVETGYVVHAEGGSYRGMRGGGLAVDNAGKVIRTFRGDAGAGHLKNFFDAVRNDTPESLVAPIQVGHSSAGWAHLLNAAYRAGGIEGLSEPPVKAQEAVGFEQLQKLIGGQLEAYNLVGSKELRSSLLLEVDVEGERFVGEGAEAANLYLDKPRYRVEFAIPG